METPTYDALRCEYAEYADEELLQLVADPHSLTDVAQDALRFELDRRGLTDANGTILPIQPMIDKPLPTGDDSPVSSVLELIGRWIVAWAAVIFVVWVIVAVGLVLHPRSVYAYFDRLGWITHNHDTPVWIQDDWLVGEYRNCEMRTKTQEQSVVDDLDKLPRLFCGKEDDGFFLFLLQTSLLLPADTHVGVTGYEVDSEFHTFPVRYHGRIDRRDKYVISWKCQRLSASLECWAVN